mmetsp:Transcript_4068/g.13248  ORF Transcript_4068/g.13248 Transcript_4068/m.13248 type:complete len:215 (+) Transcript_4068:436-1080(+)
MGRANVALVAYSLCGCTWFRTLPASLPCTLPFPQVHQRQVAPVSEMPLFRLPSWVPPTNDFSSNTSTSSLAMRHRPRMSRWPWHSRPTTRHGLAHSTALRTSRRPSSVPSLARTARRRTRRSRPAVLPHRWCRVPCCPPRRPCTWTPCSDSTTHSKHTMGATAAPSARNVSRLPCGSGCACRPTCYVVASSSEAVARPPVHTTSRPRATVAVWQ